MSFYLFGGGEKQLLDLVVSDNLSELQSILSKSSYTPTVLNQRVDNYSNNLLHLAVMNSNSQIVKLLLEKGLDQTHKNKWNQTPWDLAIQMHNKSVIQAFVDNNILRAQNSFIKLDYNPASEYNQLKDKLNYANQKIDILSTSYRDHLTCLSKTEQVDLINFKSRHSDCMNFITDYQNLKSTNKILETDNKEHIISKKRLRDESDNLIRENQQLKSQSDNLIKENKQLIIENTSLLSANKKLKISVDSLIANSRKQ